MQFFTAPQIIVRHDDHEKLVGSIGAISCGGHHTKDTVGIGYWLRKEKMRITVTTHRYSTVGEMAIWDETLPDAETHLDVIVEFASVEDANRFVAYWG